MKYEVRSYYYDGSWHYVQTYLETEDLEKAVKRFYEVITYRTCMNVVWVEFSLLGIDELGQITTMIELKKRSNI